MPRKRVSKTAQVVKEEDSSALTKEVDSLENSRSTDDFSELKANSTEKVPESKIVDEKNSNKEEDSNVHNKETDSPETSRSSDGFSGLEDHITENVPETQVVDDKNAAYSSGIITEKMLEEEKLIEKQNAENMKKMMEEQMKQAEEEKCFKRLKLLLSKSSIYAKFMTEKLRKHEEKKPQEGKGKKRKQEASEVPAKESRQKKMKMAVNNVLDVYKKENMENMALSSEIKKEEEIPKKGEVQPILLSGGVMREYQLEGFDWMKQLFENGVNGILADEMGLGKTIQCIAFVAHLVEMGITGPFFICGPLSTVPNWHIEFQRFAPDIPTIVYHGDKNERAQMRNKINKKVRVNDKFSTCPVVITSYSIALLDAAFLRRFQFRLLVIDEAHRIKNFQCALVGALKTYNTIHRLLLTGTPLQNNLAELWSLLNFILPEIFDDLQVFQSWFDVARIANTAGGSSEFVAKEQEKQIISTIHEILAPFLLRRTKADVQLDLPPKKEIIVHARLTPLQQKYYAKALDRTIDKVFKEENRWEVLEDGVKRNRKQTSITGCDELDLAKLASSSSKYSKKPKDNDEEVDVFSEVNIQLRNISMLLRKICGHPYLISYPIDPTNDGYLVDENLIRNSGKLLLLDTMLPKLKERGHRVLIFSQFVTMLRILEDYCNYRNYKYVNLYGTSKLEERQENIVDFNRDESIFIFLISTRAGGLGINLAAADTVILYDSDWNPQGDLQAQDRCHRIGQTRPVIVYRFIIPHTVDQKIIDYAKAKRQLEKVIIQKGRFKSKDSVANYWKITRQEMLDLLESRDFNDLVETDDSSVISPKELEKILDRSDMV